MNEPRKAWRTMAPTTVDDVGVFPSRRYRAVRHKPLIYQGSCALYDTPEQSWNSKERPVMANLLPAYAEHKAREVV